MQSAESSAEQLLALISHYGKSSSYAARQAIYSEGNTPDGFYYVKDGLVGLAKIAPNGKQSLLRVYNNGHFFGYRSLLGQERYYGSTMALQATELLHFPFKNMQQLQQTVPEAFRYFTLFLAAELKEAELRLSKASAMKTRHRIIDSLLYLNSKNDGYSWTYREIGEFCGGETETIIRLCNQLKSQGILAKENRRWKIIDHDKLAALYDSY